MFFFYYYFLYVFTCRPSVSSEPHLTFNELVINVSLSQRKWFVFFKDQQVIGSHAWDQVSLLLLLSLLVFWLSLLLLLLLLLLFQSLQVFPQLLVFLWGIISLSPQVSGTLLSILATLISAVIWIVLILFWFPIPSVFFPSPCGPFQIQQLQLVSPTPSCSVAFPLFGNIQIFAYLSVFIYFQSGVRWNCKIRKITNSFLLVD